ncbi:DUF1028 domain-containing protein [Consotaella aegiceratis]|uniref:DUF1028 domain-containing protein n=1 Tax=Consotaella aegiceratis TaxID=3097961 RepID=UPI002F3E8577
MTISICARCPETGSLGMAISSSSPAVAARCAHARAGVGVVSSQNITDPSLGPRTLDRIAAGRTAREALDDVFSGYSAAPWRQLVVVDRHGRSAIFSGEHALGVHAEAHGIDCAAAGNLLADPGVPSAMVAAFERAKGDLAPRLIDALAAGLNAGGEAGPLHSAGLLVVRDVSWPIADLRVDWAELDPIGQLRSLWDIYRPQLEDYVTRSLDPGIAPSYGVPGDL